MCSRLYSSASCHHTNQVLTVLSTLCAHSHTFCAHSHTCPPVCAHAPMHTHMRYVLTHLIYAHVDSFHMCSLICAHWEILRMLILTPRVSKLEAKLSISTIALVDICAHHNMWVCVVYCFVLMCSCAHVVACVHIHVFVSMFSCIIQHYVCAHVTAWIARNKLTAFTEEKNTKNGKNKNNNNKGKSRRDEDEVDRKTQERANGKTTGEIKERESVTPNKRPRSGYQNFVYKCGPKIKYNLMEKSTTGRLKAGEFQKHCGRIWKSLSEESKEKYRPAAGMCDVSIAFIICSPLTIMCSALCAQYVLTIMWSLL